MFFFINRMWQNEMLILRLGYQRPWCHLAYPLFLELLSLFTIEKQAVTLWTILWPYGVVHMTRDWGCPIAGDQWRTELLLQSTRNWFLPRALKSDPSLVESSDATAFLKDLIAALEKNLRRIRKVGLLSHRHCEK